MAASPDLFPEQLRRGGRRQGRDRQLRRARGGTPPAPAKGVELVRAQGPRQAHVELRLQEKVTAR